MSNKLGFIGCGKMAKAIIKGICDIFPKENIIASTSSKDSAQKAKKELNINVVCDNRQTAAFADIIFIATKPNQVETVLKEIKETITAKQLIVSVAAGVSTEKIENILGQIPVIRVMPNTPSLVKEGMSATAKGNFATDEQEKSVHEILSKIGRVISVEESQIDVVTAISGSGPAFFYQIFEDMAQAGVNLGLDYDKSLLLAVQTAIGSAKMTLNREKPLTDLIASVATKGGCTEVGINTMKELKSGDFFKNIIEKTTKKAHELG
ncbi:pyrroline-5-carboxylate reductase [bacterium]|nr:pyrroline-5-carboxylate reductase [bacterium]